MVLPSQEQEGGNRVGRTSDPSGKVVNVPLGLGEGLKTGNQEDQWGNNDGEGDTEQLTCIAIIAIITTSSQFFPPVPITDG